MPARRMRGTGSRRWDSDSAELADEALALCAGLDPSLPTSKKLPVFMRVLRRCAARYREPKNHPPVILSERVGAGVGAKDRRTNPGADPRSSQRSFAPLGPTHPSLRMTILDYRS